jgi:hypothetical protein
MALILILLATVLSATVAMLLMPKPKVKPAPFEYLPRTEPPPHIEVEEQFEFDPLAFWLFPDWDGPIKEPFWMRPLKVPAQPATPIRGRPIPLAWGGSVTYGGFESPPPRIREFVVDVNGEVITHFGIYGRSGANG